MKIWLHAVRSWEMLPSDSTDHLLEQTYPFFLFYKSSCFNGIYLYFNFLAMVAGWFSDYKYRYIILFWLVFLHCFYSEFIYFIYMFFCLFYYQAYIKFIALLWKNKCLLFRLSFIYYYTVQFIHFNSWILFYFICWSFILNVHLTAEAA